MSNKVDPANFWRHITIKSEHDCWIWVGAQTGDYGQTSYNYKHWLAHRLAYVLSGNLLPENFNDLFVCHSCDTPLCCNPKHLFLGTALINNHDKCRKKRQARGATHGLVKLTEQDVIYIRSHPEISGYKLAELFNVGPKSVYDVKQFKTWRWVKMPPNLPSSL